MANERAIMSTLDNTVLSVGGRALEPEPARWATPRTFFSLPSEIRNIIYELLLVHEGPFDVIPKHQRSSYDNRQLTPALLCTNKLIHAEASSLLYGQNCFDFSATDPEEGVSFINEIGTTNTGYIRHVIIDCPYFEPEDGDFDAADATLLATLESRCARLSTLTTALMTTSGMERRLDSLDNHQAATEALTLLNNRFRAIPSLQEIIVQVYEEAPSDYIRQQMKALGWTIRTFEEEDWGGNDNDWDDVDYFHREEDDFGYGDEDDDYDIDDDSDFWRRTAD